MVSLFLVICIFKHGIIYTANQTLLEAIRYISSNTKVWLRKAQRQIIIFHVYL